MRCQKYALMELVPGAGENILCLSTSFLSILVMFSKLQLTPSIICLFQICHFTVFLILFLCLFIPNFTAVALPSPVFLFCFVFSVTIKRPYFKRYHQNLKKQMSC